MHFSHVVKVLALFFSSEKIQSFDSWKGMTFDGLCDVLARVREHRNLAGDCLQTLEGTEYLLVRVIRWLSSNGVTSKWGGGTINGEGTCRALLDGQADLGEWIAAVNTISAALSSSIPSSMPSSVERARKYLQPFLPDAPQAEDNDCTALLERSSRCLFTFVQCGLSENLTMLEDSLSHLCPVTTSDSVSVIENTEASTLAICLQETIQNAICALSSKSAEQLAKTDSAISLVSVALRSMARRLDDNNTVAAPLSPAISGSSDQALAALLLTAVESCHLEIAILDQIVGLAKASNSELIIGLLRSVLSTADLSRLCHRIRTVLEEERQFLTGTIHAASEAALCGLRACNERREVVILSAEARSRADIQGAHKEERHVLESTHQTELNQLYRIQQARRARLLSPPPVSPPPSPPPKANPVIGDTSACPLSCRDRFFSQLPKDVSTVQVSDAVSQFCHKSFSLFWSIAAAHHFGFPGCLCCLQSKTSFLLAGLEDFAALSRMLGFGDDSPVTRKLFRVLCRLEQLLRSGTIAKIVSTTPVAVVSAVYDPAADSAVMSWLFETLWFYDQHGSRGSTSIADKSSSLAPSPYLIPDANDPETSSRREGFFRHRTVFGFVPLNAIVVVDSSNSFRLIFDESWGGSHTTHSSGIVSCEPQTYLLHDLFTSPTSILRSAAHGVDQRAAVIATTLMRRLLLVFCKLQKSKMCSDFYCCPLELLDRVPCVTQMCVVPKWTIQFCETVLTNTANPNWLDEVESSANGINFFLGLYPPPVYQLILASQRVTAEADCREPKADAVALLAMAMLRAPCAPMYHDTARAVIDRFIRAAVEESTADTQGSGSLEATKTSPASLYRYTEDEIWTPLIRETRRIRERRGQQDLVAADLGYADEVSVNLLDAPAARRRWHHMDHAASSPPDVIFPHRASTGSVATATVSPSGVEGRLSHEGQFSPVGSKTNQQLLQDKFDDLCNTPLPEQPLRHRSSVLTASSSRRQKKFTSGDGGPSSPLTASSVSTSASKVKAITTTVGRCCTPADDKLCSVVQGILAATDHCGIFIESSASTSIQPATPRSQARLRAACPSHRSPFRVTGVDFVKNEMLMGRYQLYRDGLVQTKRALLANSNRPAAFLVSPVDELTAILNPHSTAPGNSSFSPAFSARFILEALHEFDSHRFPLTGCTDESDLGERQTFMNEVVLLMGTTAESAVQIVSEGLSYSDHRRTVGGIVSSYTQQNPVKPGYHFSNCLCHAHAHAKPSCTPSTSRVVVDKENVSSMVERVLLVFRVVLGNAAISSRQQSADDISRRGPQHAMAAFDSSIVGDATGHCDFVVSHRDAAVPILVIRYMSN